MEAGVTSSCRSILDKPYKQLTEEDISQLTREDCRKFLKEKGMRRPSWNKSQAIQQVLSLKRLLESGDDSGAGALRRVLVSQPPPPPPPPPPQQQNAAPVESNSAEPVKATVFGEEGVSYRRKDPPKPIPSGEISCRNGDTDNKNISPRSPCETNELGGQMTIFYCGKVNVYDGVPPDKAKAIMHLAATPIDLPQDNQFTGNIAVRSFVCHLEAASDKHVFVPSTALNSQTMQTEKMTEYPQQYHERGNFTRDTDGQANRKVSLQRYLDKRKDRGRNIKGRKSAGQTSSNLEIYLNHQVRTQNANGQSSRSSTSSPPETGLPRLICSSTENQTKNLNVDLNDESNQEC